MTPAVAERLGRGEDMGPGVWGTKGGGNWGRPFASEKNLFVRHQ